MSGDVERPEEDGAEEHQVDGAHSAHECSTLPLDFRAMAEPTRDDVDALVGPATPHFAYQIRARVRELVAGPPATTTCARLRGGADGAARQTGPRLVEGG